MVRGDCGSELYQDQYRIESRGLRDSTICKEGLGHRRARNDKGTAGFR